MGSSILGPSSCNEQDGVRCFPHSASSLSWQDSSSASVKSRIERERACEVIFLSSETENISFEIFNRVNLTCGVKYYVYLTGNLWTHWVGIAVLSKIQSNLKGYEADFFVCESDNALFG